MHFHELFEKIDTTALFNTAFDAVLTVLNATYERPKARLEAISWALVSATFTYTQQWKSGIRNPRGYELDRMHLSVITRISNHAGASFQSHRSDNGVLLGQIIVHVPPYEELFEPSLTSDFAHRLAEQIADAFEHEMVHYTQDVSIAPDDPSVRSRIRKANAYPVTDAEADRMTDIVRGRYLSSRNEISAHAVNAARELRRAFGDSAESMCKNLSSSDAINASQVVAKYVRLVRPGHHNAWKSFQRQVAMNLSQQP